MSSCLVASFLLSCALRAYAAPTFLCPPGDVAHRKLAYAVPIGTHFVPVLASHRPGKKYRKAIVVVHGRYQSDQGLYFGSVSDVVHSHGLDEDIVVVAPTFPDKDCHEGLWKGGDPYFKALQWSRNTHQWTFGMNSDRGNVSSFKAMDDVVAWVAEKYKVEDIVVVGFSAGGQMVLRWAIMSPLGVNGTTHGGVPLQIVVGSPSTYEYLDDKRPDVSCSPDAQTGVEHTCANFSRPQAGSRRRGTQIANSCNGRWNVYGYGLDGLQDTPPNASAELVSLHSYLNNTITGEQRYADYIPDRFRTKDFSLAVGTKDQRSCKNWGCTSDCASMTQGSNRLQRAINFKHYLENLFPGYATKFGTFDAGHDFKKFFESPLFFDWTMKGDLGHGGRLLSEAVTPAHTSSTVLV